MHFFKTLNLKLNQFLSQKACFENKNDFTLQEKHKVWMLLAI